jgi:hypothetical protein
VLMRRSHGCLGIMDGQLKNKAALSFTAGVTKYRILALDCFFVISPSPVFLLFETGH